MDRSTCMSSQAKCHQLFLCFIRQIFAVAKLRQVKGAVAAATAVATVFAIVSFYGSLLQFK